MTSIPAGGTGGEELAYAIIFVAGALGLLFALYQFYFISKIDLTLGERYTSSAQNATSNPVFESSKESEEKTDNTEVTNGQTEKKDVPATDAKAEDKPSSETTQEKLTTIAEAISVGAQSFLKAEYSICSLFILFFSILILVLVGSSENCGIGALNVGEPVESIEDSCWPRGGLTMLAFIIGAVTSMASGYIGMMVAVYTNVRTSVEATRGWTPAFNAAFRGGAVMGFALSSLGLLVLAILILLYRVYFDDEFDSADPNDGAARLRFKFLMEAIAGYGLGGSTVALFGRVGGGIYTKAADVGADLVGKVEQNIPEDDPRNPATIADNVGDNVGDIAGMGSDLFGSFAESTCAALVLASTSVQLQENFGSILFPLVISALGIIVCILTSFVATHIDKVKGEKDVERVLKIQLILSTVLLTPVLGGAARVFLPDEFCFNLSDEDCLSNDENISHWWGAFISIACGLWAGLLTGLVTEYFTSFSYKPVKEVAKSSETGAATLIIYGLALGYKSTIIPVALLSLTIFVSFYLVNLFGVALAALGMLSSLAIGLTIDAYGPITDNAGGIAEMAELGDDIRHITDTLDAAGNTTAAIGKGFAIGSAALVSLALFGAFVVTLKDVDVVDILDPIVFSLLLVGAMLPYWFSAMTMKSVGIAAFAMVEEVRRQFKENPEILTGGKKPDYDKCIQISTRASLKEMIAPGALVIISPIITGYLLGVFALSGLLAGSLVSSVQMALSSSNTGGAWDNAKKYIEQGNLGGKGSDNHKAAVVGDTVGDPLKDTSGPALNILMKLMAILSLVFAESFQERAIPNGESWAGYN